MPQYPARRRRRISEDVVALITQARLEHEFGASRTRIWLERVHRVRVATETIQRVFPDIGAAPREDTAAPPEAAEAL